MNICLALLLLVITAHACAESIVMASSSTSMIEVSRIKASQIKASQIKASRIETAHLPGRRTYRLDLTDAAIYTSIVAYRTMDFFSSQPCLHSRYCGEGELPHVIVATKPGFAAFEVLMAASEIGSSCWMHRHGHGRFARAVDLFSISTGTATVLHNYAVPKYR